ncbi:ATP-binding cassette domain-containing protein [Paracoccus sp. S-4012]|uniref:ABC transporter ATP-binding protein n=1 Tax=Paracoccus sp. S-4012 TaxID=2665648 RepID=UPI0012AF635D|nr:ABC transporter ATP-binding protein [Paracoccus sp. S-4012]MRX52043.1 ATP-binding cassette domain-containing protein [Paracoccus sp. S-4012]
MISGARIDLVDVGITLGGNRIVEGVDLEIGAGEFVCLLGPSGCGKSTLLNAIAGFLPVQGRLSVDGRPVSGPGTDRGVVFQSSDVLFPWLTAQENVEYGPRCLGVPAKERASRAIEFLQLVGLGGATGKFPRELSGGMRQRLQLARVLINNPSVVLMDEPFGALDAQTRDVMQRELDRIWRKTGQTIIFVTHDISEAILLADRVVTMTTGPAARLKSIHAVDLPRPRNPDTPEAVRLHALLRDEIGEEVSKVLRMQGLEGEEG